jgi:hypothetical protein
MAGARPTEYALPSKISGPTQNEISPLTVLPAELRNKIFTLSFQDHISHYSIEYSTRSTKRASRMNANNPCEVVEKKVKAKEPGLIMACKQTHQEALAIFYDNTKVQFDNTQYLEDWARNVGWQRVDRVKCLLMSERPFQEEQYTLPLPGDIVALAGTCRDFGLTSDIDVWFKTGPLHDETIGLSFCLWSKKPLSDAKDAEVYLVLRDHSQRAKVIAYIRRMFPGREYPRLPSWLIPIDTALKHDAGWSRGETRTFWAAT